MQVGNTRLGYFSDGKMWVALKMLKANVWRLTRHPFASVGMFATELNTKYLQMDASKLENLVKGCC
jgi:hypothetical protein